MKIYTYQDFVKLHVELFGVEPVITGINFRDSDELIDKIADAIADGVPYVESEVPEGMLT
jgi:hypothetical protein